jgi:hypothetical protein
MRPVNLSLMKAVLGMMPALNDASKLGKMREIYPLPIFRMQNIVILPRNSMIVNAVALLSMTLFLTALSESDYFKAICQVTCLTTHD